MLHLFIYFFYSCPIPWNWWAPVWRSRDCGLSLSVWSGCSFHSLQLLAHKPEKCFHFKMSTLQQNLIKKHKKGIHIYCLNSPSMRIFTTFISVLACSQRSCSILELWSFAFLPSSVTSWGRHTPMQIWGTIHCFHMQPGSFGTIVKHGLHKLWLLITMANNNNSKAYLLKYKQTRT